MNQNCSLLDVIVVPVHGESKVDYSKYLLLPMHGSQDFFSEVAEVNGEYKPGSGNKIILLLQKSSKVSIKKIKEMQ